MLYIIMTILLAVLLYIFYLRYFPILGIPCIDIKSSQHQELNNVKLDIRDYSTSARQRVKGSLEIPIAYLKRHYRDIPQKEIHVIASDVMEKNIAIRFLRNKGYKVIGYTIMNCDCSRKKRQIA